MTINELLSMLRDANSELEQAGVDDTDEAKLDLETLIIQLKRQIVMRSFDPLRDISQMTVVDVSQLRTLIPQLAEVIRQEERRTALIKRITHIARSALRGAGVPIPV